jgi:hypothetical protein
MCGEIAHGTFSICGKEHSCPTFTAAEYALDKCFMIIALQARGMDGVFLDRGYTIFKVLKAAHDLVLAAVTFSATSCPSPSLP